MKETILFYYNVMKNGKNKGAFLKEATKDLYGIFPKKLVIETLYFLFPKNKKLAVSNKKNTFKIKLKGIFSEIVILGGLLFLWGIKFYIIFMFFIYIYFDEKFFKKVLNFLKFL